MSHPRARLERMSDLLAGLNEEQRTVAEFEGGPLRVLAGAGTGKTTALSGRVTVVMLRRWLSVSGVSRASSTKRRRSLSTTSAARAMSEVVVPQAISASVFIEQGATTMPKVR